MTTVVRRHFSSPWITRVRNKCLRALAGAGAILLPCTAQGQQHVEHVGTIDRIVHSQVDSGFSGVVLVAAGDHVLLKRAYAPQQEGMSANSVFWIASITKGFTAAAVLRLQKEGRLSVHDSLFRFLPDVPADKRNITIHQLLTHTSGLGGEYSGGGISDRSRAVQSILAPNLIFQPGAGYKYGDDDYELLAAIIEIVSGKTWENYVQKELLTPMHLAHTGFACQPHRGPVVGRAGNPENPPVSCDWGHKGANGMYSTAADLLEWTRMTVLNHSPATRPQILVRKEPPFDVSYGYGVRIYTLGDKVVEVVHSGRGDDDHTSIVRMLSSGETVIVLSNAGQHAGTTWASYIARQLASR